MMTTAPAIARAAPARSMRVGACPSPAIHVTRRRCFRASMSTFVSSRAHAGPPETFD
jgi:hypothetical protein